MVAKNEFNSCHQRLFPQGHEPSEMDILCGGQGRRSSRTSNNKTKNLQDWPGNKRYTQILSDHVHRYVKATKRVEKTAVVVSILDVIAASGTRFVKLDKATGRYCELTSDQIYEKTSHSIRALVKAGNKNKVTTACTSLISQGRDTSTPKHRSKSMTTIREMKRNSQNEENVTKLAGGEYRSADSSSSIVAVPDQSLVTSTTTGIMATNSVMDEQVPTTSIFASTSMKNDEEIYMDMLTNTTSAATTYSCGTSPMSAVFSPIPPALLSSSATTSTANSIGSSSSSSSSNSSNSSFTDQSFDYNCDTYDYTDCLYDQDHDDDLEYNDMAPFLEILQTLDL